MDHKATPESIRGYAYGAAEVARSPVSLDELRLLEQTVTLTDEDRRYLRLAGDVLQDQAEQVVDSWRSVIGAQPHLARWFFGPDGKPDEAYKAAVKKRFVQWVLDTCRRPHDQAWLDYQEEIGLRHTPAKKNVTDGARTPPRVPLRYLIAFTAVVNTTIRPFLAAEGNSPDEVENMQQAWNKAVMLQVALWSRPYTKEGEW
ncbi:MAG: protoglobin domain-containing protein [Burkholderiales bacterium]